MCFIFSLIPAVQKFGQVLAIWAFIVALFFPTMGLYVTLSGLCPIGELIQTVHPG
jgi:hypothetical protein